MEQPARARIFLSCGQQKGSDEIKIAKAISRNLDRQGFATYIAVEEQTLEGVTDNIFKKLEESEYFIFIDFRREPLGGLNKGKPVYRGGLFSQQELAVATFLTTCRNISDGVRPYPLNRYFDLGILSHEVINSLTSLLTLYTALCLFIDWQRPTDEQPPPTVYKWKQILLSLYISLKNKLG